MTDTVANLIERARGYHPAFSQTKNPDKVLRLRAADYVRRLYGRIIELDEVALATWATVDAGQIITGLANNSPVDSAMLFLEVWANHTNLGRTKVALLTYADIASQAHNYPLIAYVAGNGLYLANQSQLGRRDLFPYGDSPATRRLNGWEDVRSLSVLSVGSPLDPRGRANVLDLPRQMEDAVVADLVLFMSSRMGAAMPGAVQNAQDAEQAAITGLTHQSRTSNWYIE